MSVQVLKDIREELRELRLLYKELVENSYQPKNPLKKREKPSKKKTKLPKKKN